VNINHWKMHTRFALYAFFMLLIVLLSISCASVSPVPANPEQLNTFASIENIEPFWLPHTNGINFFHGKITSPRLEFWALQIDLSAPEIEIVINNNAYSTKVSSFVRDNNLIAGINALPFDISTSREGLPIKNIGIVISGGEIFSPANPNYDALVFYKGEGRAAIIRQPLIRTAGNIENAAGGFHQILTGGTPAQRTLSSESASTPVSATRHPRSAAGLSANGRFLYLLVIDGRRNGSAGATEYETALLLRFLGSHDGINLDGGGSSVLVMRYPDNSIKVKNTPIHGGIPGRERAVAGSIGIRLGNP